MAESTSVAPAAAPTPSSADIARAEAFVRDRFLHEGEDAAVALAAGSPRRRALDQALTELDAGAKHPSTGWRRDYSLLLGLERLLSEEEPKLADGTVLSAHQVDALSGTLTALLAEAQRTNGNGKLAAAAASPELLASAAILGPDEAPATDGREGRASTTTAAEATGARSAARYDDDPSEADEDSEEEDEDAGEEDDSDDEELGRSSAPPPTMMRTRTTRMMRTRRSSPTMTRRRRASSRPKGTSRRKSPKIGSMTQTRTRSRWPSSRRTQTRPSGSGSSTPPARARRSPRSGSWRPRGRAGS